MKKSLVIGLMVGLLMVQSPVPVKANCNFGNDCYLSGFFMGAGVAFLISAVISLIEMSLEENENCPSPATKNSGITSHNGDSRCLKDKL